jgi:hypothetical protein
MKQAPVRSLPFAAYDWTQSGACPRLSQLISHRPRCCFSAGPSQAWCEPVECVRLPSDSAMRGCRRHETISDSAMSRLQSSNAFNGVSFVSNPLSPRHLLRTSFQQCCLSYLAQPWTSGLDVGWHTHGPGPGRFLASPGFRKEQPKEMLTVLVQRPLMTTFLSHRPRTLFLPFSSSNGMVQCRVHSLHFYNLKKAQCWGPDLDRQRLFSLLLTQDLLTKYIFFQLWVVFSFPRTHII